MVDYSGWECPNCKEAKLESNENDDYQCSDCESIYTQYDLEGIY